MREAIQTTVRLDVMARAQAHPTEREAPAGERFQYGIVLARLGQEAVARFRCSLRPLNLSAQQYLVLKQLQASGPTSQATVADALAIDYSNLSAVSAELQARGLIERLRDEADRRRYVIELTDDGTRLVADADAAIASSEDDLMASLDESERQQLWDLLCRMAEELDFYPGTAVEACATVEGQAPGG